MKPESERGELERAFNKATDFGMVEGGADVMEMEALVTTVAQRFGFDRDELVEGINGFNRMFGEILDAYELDPKIRVPLASNLGSLVIVLTVKTLMAGMMVVEDRNEG